MENIMSMGINWSGTGTRRGYAQFLLVEKVVCIDVGWKRCLVI